jgi:hypothetical protein
MISKIKSGTRRAMAKSTSLSMEDSYNYRNESSSGRGCYQFVTSKEVEEDFSRPSPKISSWRRE